MAVVYELCSEDVDQLAHGLIQKHHPDLRDKAKPVKVEYVFAELEPNSNGDRPSGDAVKLHGVACFAVVRIIPAKQRALGRGDAEVTIDKAKWEKMPMPRRQALLDHELEHLLVKRDNAGAMVLDAYERPRLKLKPHDWDFGWFDTIARRHGANSIEVQQAHKIADAAGKIYFQAEFGFLKAA